MAYIVIREVKGKKYYYAVESVREKGSKNAKQKIVDYIGSEEKLLKRLGIQNKDE